MEAAASTLTRSLSLSPRTRSARFACPNHCPFSTALASPRASTLPPLRRARSDVATAAVVLRHPLIPPVLETADHDEEKGRRNNTESPAELLLDGAGAGRNGGGGGGGSCGRGGGGDGSGSGSSGCGMGEYYRRVLRVDPENPLLLRNYGTYLHDVEHDLAGAEACYARALLAAPADADLLSLYGRVIWEARQEKDRAAGYLERAVQAAPDDCYVLGSYASFLWDAEDDDDDEEVSDPADLKKDSSARGSPALVPAC